MSDFSVYNNIQRTFPQPTAATPKPETSGGSFGDMLKGAIDQVNNLEKGSDSELQKYVNDDSDLHSVMLALEKADLSFQVMMQVRNKIVAAYQEIMKSQI